MENNKPLLDYRDCVIDFCKEKVSENIDENVRR